jgi:hypothetical protein
MLPRTLRLVYVVPSDRPYAPAYAVRSDRHCGLWPYDGQAGSNPKVRFADDPLAIALAAARTRLLGRVPSRGSSPVCAATARDFGSVLYFALKVKLTVAGFPAATVTF